MPAKRYLVLFAREPGREALAKGLSAPGAAEVFAGFARGWLDAARRSGAHLVLATPPEDRLAWARTLRPGAGVSLLVQRGDTFGKRLENAARSVAALGGSALVVGGDVVPSAHGLAAAFESLEAGADAVLARSPDGGISALSIPDADVGLLSRIAPRRRDAFERLAAALRARGRAVVFLPDSRDVDGPRSLRALVRSDGDSALRRVARLALAAAPQTLRPQPLARSTPALDSSPGLRAPPAAA